MWVRDHFNSVCAAGQRGRWGVESTIWRRKTNEKNGREERRKETQPLLSTHLMLPAGPRDADGTVLLIHPRSPTSSLIFFAPGLYPRCPSAAPFVMRSNLSRRPLSRPCENGAFAVRSSGLLMHTPAVAVSSFEVLHYIISHKRWELKSNGGVPQSWKINLLLDLMSSCYILNSFHEILLNITPT